MSITNPHFKPLSESTPGFDPINSQSHDISRFFSIVMFNFTFFLRRTTTQASCSAQHFIPSYGNSTFSASI